MLEDEFDDFYRARFSSVVRGLYLQTGNLDRAEECAQEAFVRAWLHRSDLRSSDPVGWVMRSAWRLAMSDWRRGQRRAMAMEKLGALPPDPPEPPEDFVTATEMIAGLPREQRATVVLHYFHDLAVDEVARTLAIPAGTVKSRLSRARDSLRAAQELTTGRGNQGESP